MVKELDKYYLENAFKSLDELEAEQKKLREDYIKKCAGNPDINTAAFNHATDVGTEAIAESLDDDELWDKYFDKDIYFNGKKGKVTGLVRGNNDFVSSRWEVTFDDGSKQNLTGKFLSFNLEEKLPRDLANAYSNTPVRRVNKADKQFELASQGLSSDSKDNVSKLKRDRRSVPMDLKTKDPNTGDVTSTYNQDISFDLPDYDKAEYKVISKEEAKDVKKSERYKLRAITKNNQVIQWSRKGEIISDVDMWGAFRDTEFRNKNITSVPFDQIIDNCSKIYYTDEDETLRKAIIPSNKSYEKKYLNDLGVSTNREPYDSGRRYSRITNRNLIPGDTGSHDYARMLNNIKQDFKKALDSVAYYKGKKNWYDYWLADAQRRFENLTHLKEFQDLPYNYSLYLKRYFIEAIKGSLNK